MPRLRSLLDFLKPKTFLPLADLLLVNASVLAGLWLWTVRDDFRVFDSQFVSGRAHWFLVMSAGWLLMAVVQDFYHRRRSRQLLASLTTLAGMTGLLVVAYIAVYFFAPRDNTLPRGTILSIVGASFLFVGSWRLGYVAVTNGWSRDQIVAAINPRAISGFRQANGAPPVDKAVPLEEEVLTVQEVAEHLKVSQATVWRWCKSGKLPAFRVGQQWRIRATDLHVVMDGERVAS